MQFSVLATHTGDGFSNAGQTLSLASDRAFQQTESIGIELTESGSNYRVWKELQQLILESSDLFCLIDRAEIKPDEQDGLLVSEKWKGRNMKAMSRPALNMDMDLYGELGISKEKSASSLWREINNLLEHNEFLARATASARLHAKGIQAGEYMENHIRDMCKLKRGFINAGGNLKDDDWLIIIIGSLQEHPKWKHSMPFPETFKLAGEGYIDYHNSTVTSGFGNGIIQEPALQSQTKSNNRPRKNEPERSAPYVHDVFRPGWRRRSQQLIGV